MNPIDTKAVREELAQALSRKFDDSVGVAVYGAGDTAERWFAADMEENGSAERVVCFIDDTPAKQGGYFHGKPIVNFQEAHERCKSCLILICSVVPRTRDIMKSALERQPVEGASICVLDEYILCRHAEEVLSVYDMLEDDLSKASYANILLARMGKVRQNCDLVQRDHQYFGIPEFMADYFHGECFVDCGAYVGDTIEQFLTERGGLFGKIFAFEPCGRTFEALRSRMDRVKREWGIPDEKIELIHAGLAEKSCQVEERDSAKPVFEDPRFDLLNRPEVETGGIRICAIDEYFENEPVSFIKADIEGFECQMLDGAVKVIQRDKPRLAVCMYHSSFDMYRIALKIKEICPEYKLAMRQHSYTFNESVIYAYI